VDESTSQDPSSYLPLSPTTLHVLLALRNGEKHGYAIMREVREGSEGAVRMGPGTLYGSIKRMLGDGLIEESEERSESDVADQRRRYYRLTGLGERVCDAEIARLRLLVDRARFNLRSRGLVPRRGEA
jgi:DNA-binding PadR family transcriptional regulator